MAMRKIGEMQVNLRRRKVAEANARARPPRAGQSFQDDSLHTRIPNVWIRGETLIGLTPTEILVLLRVYFAALRAAKWSPDRVWDIEFTITQKEIAGSTLLVRQVRRAIHSLCKKRYIIKKRKDRKKPSRSNSYFLGPKARRSATSKA